MNNKEIARELVGKWGYEHEDWWKPIQEALEQKDQQMREMINSCPLDTMNAWTDVTPRKVLDIFDWKQEQLNKLI